MRLHKILACLILLAAVGSFVSSRHHALTYRVPDGLDHAYKVIQALDPATDLQAQTAPASAVPATPSSVYGAAFTSYATTTGGGGMSMQIYKATGNVSVGSTGLNTMYVYWASCLNTSATAVAATLKDGTAVAAQIPCPASAASLGVSSFNPPIRITPGVTPTMTATTAETTLYFMLGGYMDQR